MTTTSTTVVGAILQVVKLGTITRLGSPELCSAVGPNSFGHSFKSAKRRGLVLIARINSDLQAELTQDLSAMGIQARPGHPHRSRRVGEMHWHAGHLQA